MFGSIAARYDLANHLLSCGIDLSWRKHAAEIVASWRPNEIVDLASGTGDLALALQKKLPGAEIVAVDFLPEMLELAKRKGVHQTVVADAMKLPFVDGSFDCVSIAFGLRNMEDWGEALREMSRVLRANGHLLVLEFSLPTISILTREKSAYDYLGDSIEEFPSGNAMCQLIAASGFHDANAQPLSGGIVTIYTAAKIGST